MNEMSNSTLAALSSDLDPIISDDIMQEWLGVVVSCVILATSLLGIVTNIINVRVFVRQGLSSDSNTIGLFALAVADFFGCAFLVPYTLGCGILLRYAAPPNMYVSCHYLRYTYADIAHGVMSHVACWITVYIAIERCMCVLIPFKVKILIRPKVTTAAMILIYVTIIISFIPYLSTYRIHWKFLSEFNSSAVVMYGTEIGKIYLRYTSLVLNTILTTLAFFMVAITTGVMLYKLKKIQKWRQKTTTTGSAEPIKGANTTKGDNSDSSKSDGAGVGKKDIEVLKMVLVVTSVFLVCLSGSCIPGFATSLFPGIDIDGFNKNLTFLLYYCKFEFDVINSALNFFFYVRISSRYRATFDDIYRRRPTR